jgi:hypothetical protein
MLPSGIVGAPTPVAIMANVNPSITASASRRQLLVTAFEDLERAGTTLFGKRATGRDV